MSLVAFDKKVIHLFTWKIGFFFVFLDKMQIIFLVRQRSFPKGRISVNWWKPELKFHYANTLFVDIVPFHEVNAKQSRCVNED